MPIDVSLSANLDVSAFDACSFIHNAAGAQKSRLNIYHSRRMNLAAFTDFKRHQINNLSTS
jgi:hypothetical protein